MTVDEFLSRFHNVRQTGHGEWMAQCPAHQDSNASLHLTDKGDVFLMHCFAGCRETDILQQLGLTWRDYPYHRENERPSTPPKYGLTLRQYADAKRFPIEALRGFFLADGMRTGKESGKQSPGVQMPYLNLDGSLAKMRWRMRLEKEQGSEPSRFVWETGGQMCLYGLWRQPPDRSSVIVVEGESDCHALWVNGFSALGLPGASNYKPSRDDAVLEAYKTVYVHLEKDAGGQTVYLRFAGEPEKKHRPSSVLPKCLFFTLPGYKDPSDAWQQLADRPGEFCALMSNALRNAKPAGQFPPPPGWPNPDAPREREGRDARAATSPENGLRGGRPSADYAGLATAYLRRLVTPDGLPLLRFWRGAWYQYNGQCWKPCIDSDVEARAMAFLQEEGVAEAYHVQVSRNALTNLLANLRSTSFCGIPAETPAPAWISTGEPAKGWIAMENTLVNLELAAEQLATARADGREDNLTQEEIERFTRPLTPDLLSTFALDYAFDPAAKCPKFEDWLNSTITDAEVRDVIQKLMGLALVPDTTYNVCFFLAGEGGTGKSTFLDILRALVSRANVCHVPLLKMDDKFATWPLAENLLNIVGEMPSDDPLGRLRYIEGDFKDSISGGDIHVERKGKDPCSAPCTARHVFATNSLPVFFDKSEGIWDRLRIIPFTRRFRGSSEEKRDLAGDIIATELPGILNFAIRGLDMLRSQEEQTFPDPLPCKTAKQAHRERCDPTGRYVKQFYYRSEGGTLLVKETYKHYCSWLNDEGLPRRSCPTFCEAVARVMGVNAEELDPPRDKTRVFKGLECSFAYPGHILYSNATPPF